MLFHSPNGRAFTHSLIKIKREAEAERPIIIVWTKHALLLNFVLIFEKKKKGCSTQVAE